MPSTPPTTLTPQSIAITDDPFGLLAGDGIIHAGTDQPQVSGTSIGLPSGTTVVATLESDPVMHWSGVISGTPAAGTWSIVFPDLASVRPGSYRLSFRTQSPALDLAFDVDLVSDAPYVEFIDVLPAAGRLRAGDVVGFHCHFSDAVQVEGEPALRTSIGRALLTSIGRAPLSQDLYFYGQARLPDDADRLRVYPIGFDTSVGTIKTLAGVPALLDIPQRSGGPVVDNERPTVVAVRWPAESGPAQTGDTILIDIQFSASVYVRGNPTLGLSSGGTAAYQWGSGSSILRFAYAVATGEQSRRLAILPTATGTSWELVDGIQEPVSLAGISTVSDPPLEVLMVAVEPPPVEPPPVEPPPVEPPPVEPPPVEPGTVVATVVVRNPTDAAQPASMASLGYVFAPGRVLPGRHLVSTPGQPIQVDPKTSWPDGSVCHAILTYWQPAVPAKSETRIDATIWTASQIPSDVAIPATIGGLPMISLGGLLGPGAAGVQTINLNDVIASATPDMWRSGPIATEARYIVPIAGSLRIIVDLTVHSDQTWIADIQFCNDIAMGSVGGTYVYVPTIIWGEGGAQSWTAGSISHYQYQAWTFRVYSQGEPVAYSEQSMDDLIAVGAILPFARTPATAQSIRAVLNAWMGDPTFGKPLATNGVMMAMGTTGGRADIGPVTSPVAGWVASDDPDARKVSLAWAETAGAAPWRMWDAAHSEWLSVATYPAMWTDGRSAVKPTQFTEAPGWSLDISHMPDLSFVPYLTTGRRYYLDQLCAQATWCVISCWNGPRQNGQGLVANGFTQVRGAAWGLRTIDQAAWISPAGPTRDYLVGLSDRNWAWMLSMTPQWQVWQGESYGRLPGDYAKNNSFAPWQQDYLAGSAVQAVRFGKRAPAQWLGWAKNWLVGRFFAADKGFPPWDAVAYNVAQAPKENPNLATDLFKTWADMGAGMVAANLSNNGSFAKTTNVYETWGYYSLAAMSWVDDDPTIQNAIKWLKDQDPPHIRKIEPIVDVQFNVRPKPAA